MKRSEQINELVAALSSAQGEIKGAARDSENPFFKSKYADLASCWDACKHALVKNKLCVIQTFFKTDTHELFIETTLAHASGQWVSSEYPVNPVKPDPQSLGSASTYARRYALMAIVGIATFDDDANEASGLKPMKMEQPGPQDGNANVKEGTFQSGQWKGKTPEQVYQSQHPKEGEAGLKSYVAFLDGMEGKGKLSQAMFDVRKLIEDFLGKKENAPFQDDPFL